MSDPVQEAPEDCTCLWEDTASLFDPVAALELNVPDMACPIHGEPA